MRALPHTWRASGTALQLCLQLCTPALSTPPTTRPGSHRGFHRKEHGSDGPGADRRKGQSRRSGRAGEHGPGHGQINRLLHYPAGPLLFPTVCCSLAEGTLLLTSSCSPHVPQQLSRMHYSWALSHKYTSPPNLCAVFAYTLIGKILPKSLGSG